MTHYESMVLILSLYSIGAETKPSLFAKTKLKMENILYNLLTLAMKNSIITYYDMQDYLKT
jgi:hypothetical protein